MSNPDPVTGQPASAPGPADAAIVESVFSPMGIDRPAPVLLKYYAFVSLLTGPLFPFVFMPLFFKYQTLKYKFDESGVAMSWGILFRREIHLTYRRIQDIHLNRNVIQRWMGLATLGIQTASGSATPEMSIEGILEAAPLRDFLYAQMRGAKGETDDEPINVTEDAGTDEVSQLLTEIRDSLRAMAPSSNSGQTVSSPSAGLASTDVNKSPESQA